MLRYLPRRLLPCSLLRCSLLPCLLLCLPPARAATPPPIPLHHASWSARDGAPTMVMSIAQTRDGWLWLGGPDGLFRFDGVRFERYAEAQAPLPSNSIAILSVQADGALWIGYRFGGASRLQQGQLRNYDERDGLPANSTVWGLQADGAGRMWAATSRGMFYLDGERWRPAGADWGLVANMYNTLMRDRRGALWAQGTEGVWTLAPGAARFARLPLDSGLGVLFDVPDGSVWSWDARHNRLNRLTAPAGAAQPRRWNLHGELGALLFDRAGDLWAGRVAGVDYHTAHGVSQTGPQQGLSGAVVTALFEDREANVWVATASGIDRFRRQRVASVTVPANPGAQTLAADDDGGVWSGRFHLARPGTGPGPVAATALWPASPVAGQNSVTCTYRDPDGVLWSGAYSGLWRKAGTQVRRIALPDGIAGGQFNGMARDRDGGLWVVMQQLYRLRPDGAWEHKTGVDGLPDETARVIASAPQAGLWIGYSRSRILQQQENGRWRTYGPEQGLRLGVVMALHLHGARVWAGGENGLALRQGDRFLSVAGNDGQVFEGVTGIVELENGDLWVNAASGLFRIPADDIARLAAQPAYRVRYERLDGLDGLDGAAPLLLPTPSLVRAADGKLWAATTTGVFRFDPVKSPAGPAPAVLIRKIGARGQARPASAGMALAPGTATLQIDYTALALAMPERVRFRYRLDGVDAQWQDAGRGRTAYYNNLGAGAYHFRVQASNTDGVWGDGASALDFSIAPTATQTWWFKGLCALAIVVACWVAYRLRLRQLTLQMAGRLEERLNERERIARELHDTLLQSVQGLILHVHAAAMRLPAPEPARGLIEEALLRADDVLHEGRDRVRALRSGEACAHSLAEALAEAGAQLQPPGAAPLRLLVTGTVRRLHPVVQQETVAIACEAIANAYRHAGAPAIEVQLDYRAGELHLAIRDNGAGIPPEVMACGGRQGHWGFAGMRERAARIKAKLVLHSDADHGTEWLLVLPGGLAYQARPRARILG